MHSKFYTKNNRSSFSGRKRGFNSSPGRSSGFKKKVIYKWSERDLLRSIEYSKNSAKTLTESSNYEISNPFNKLEISEVVKNNVISKGYKDPTPIQDQAIPNIISGKDVIGIANTGTGKTAAFLIPLIDKVYKNKSNKVLIIAPTRELAEQIYSEFRSFSYGTRIFSALLIGGSNLGTQISFLKTRPNFVIGTPGRIKDMIERGFLNLREFNNVVLDEADRMVDIGFVKEIKFFISLLPTQRQSLFFSATIEGKTQEILKSFVKDPITISVKKTETSQNIRQDIVKVKRKEDKVNHLHDMLIQQKIEKAIIFGNTKWGVQKLADELYDRGFKVAAIHGDKRQNQRRQILEKFKKDQINILLATDVAARGLDIKGVSHVINFDLPESYEDYVHRIGRTGRADKTGIALTFVIEDYIR